MKAVDFVKKYYPLAKKASDKFGIAPEAILSQAAIEGGWGDSYGVMNRRNHFGITASGSPNSFWDGSYSISSSSGLKFRVYKTEQDSFYDFARLIKEKYPDSAKLSSNIALYAKSIAQSPYISELNGDNRSKYESNLKDAAASMQSQIQKEKLLTDRKKNLKILIIILSLLLVVTAVALTIVKTRKK